MDVWFEFSERTFEVFFEMKLELYHTASCDVAKAFDEATRDAVLNSAMLDELRVLPASFIDMADEITQRVYFSLPSGFGNPAGPSEADDRNSDLYGELTAQGVRTLIKLAGGFQNASSESGSAPQPFRFVDLGSGTGKVVADVALCVSGLGSNLSSSSSDDTRWFPPESLSCVGVEYLEHRHLVAVAAQKLLALGVPPESADLGAFLSNLKPSVRETLSAVATQSIDFRCGSFLDLAVLPPPEVQPVNLFFCCGVGFGKEMIGDICDLISKFVLHQGGSSFRGALLLFKERPQHPLFDSLCSVKIVKVQSTWMEETPAYWLEPHDRTSVLAHGTTKKNSPPPVVRPSTIEAAD